MPNRKKEVGWYLLPKSGTPYYGELPDDTKAITEAEAKKAAKAIEKDSGEPVTSNSGDGSPGGASA
jgi:hypothetical protein